MNVGLSSYNFVPKYFKEEPSALERASNVKAGVLVLHYSHVITHTHTYDAIVGKNLV